ncbi:hypothetical protein TanjilG_28692 [Lupinus angustifolius]|uniref:GST C-terminal domain-containing protein n=1 Tax=Lupinus angustifolius TaxID=3871 RepID=A0A1J7FZT0_LUPAN|nr:hypothetical protein TanjilG_28692 [Lupinus angustifolius]
MQRFNRIEFEEINVDLSKGHHLSPQYTGNYALNTVIEPALGIPTSRNAAAEAEKVLLSSLSKLENIWLTGDGPFLLGGLQPSIADLSLVCEIMQLEILDEKDCSRILSRYKKVLRWIEDTKAAMNPHFEEVHNILYKAKKNFERQRLRVAKTGSEPSNKVGVHSKM